MEVCSAIARLIPPNYPWEDQAGPKLTFRVANVQQSANYVLTQLVYHPYVHVPPLGSSVGAAPSGTTRLSLQLAWESRHGRHPEIDSRTRR